MGLDTSHDCWHGSYGSFYSFRCEVARAAGLALRDNESQAGRQVIVLWDHDWPGEVYAGMWKQEPDDVLHVFIVHSDCDGVIPVCYCTPLAKRLEKLISRMRAPWNERLQQFIDGLNLAASCGEDVDFH